MLCLRLCFCLLCVFVECLKWCLLFVSFGVVVLCVGFIGCFLLFAFVICVCLFCLVLVLFVVVCLFLCL